jgi:putative addiction module component (TIGR02574 family)
MLSKARQVLREALALPPKARADIAGTLLRSLDAPQQASVEAAWAGEVGRRLREVASGEAKPFPWERARRLLEAAVSHGREGSFSRMIERGLADSKSGGVISHEDMGRRIEAWRR